MATKVHWKDRVSLKEIFQQAKPWGCAVIGGVMLYFMAKGGMSYASNSKGDEPQAKPTRIERIEVAQNEGVGSVLANAPTEAWGYKNAYEALQYTHLLKRVYFHLDAKTSAGEVNKKINELEKKRNRTNYDQLELYALKEALVLRKEIQAYPDSQEEDVLNETKRELANRIEAANEANALGAFKRDNLVSLRVLKREEDGIARMTGVRKFTEIQFLEYLSEYASTNGVKEEELYDTLLKENKQSKVMNKSSRSCGR